MITTYKYKTTIQTKAQAHQEIDEELELLHEQLQYKLGEQFN